MKRKTMFRHLCSPLGTRCFCILLHAFRSPFGCFQKPAQELAGRHDNLCGALHEYRKIQEAAPVKQDPRLPVFHEDAMRRKGTEEDAMRRQWVPVDAAKHRDGLRRAWRGLETPEKPWGGRGLQGPREVGHQYLKKFTFSGAAKGAPGPSYRWEKGRERHLFNFLFK